MTLSLDKSAWKRVAFGDVVRNVNETVRDLEAVGIDRIIAMEHMDPGELKINRWGSTAAGTTFTRRVKPGQTLFGKRRAYQRKVAYAEFDAVCSGDIYTFEADETRILGEFLPFLVQSEGFFNHALGTSAGSLSPRTNWRDLANFEFDLAPLDEQRRIVDLLWAIQSAVLTQQERRIALSAARQTWLDEQVAELVSKASINFSETWARSPESGFSAAPVDNVTGRYVLSLAALGPDGYRPGNLKNVPDSEQIQSATLSRGDLLVSRANTVEAVGRVGIFSEDRSDVSFPDTMMRLKLGGKVMPGFVAAVIGSAHGRRHMRRSAAGSATSMVKINRTSLGLLPFPVTSVSEQEALLLDLLRFDHAIEASIGEAETVASVGKAVSAQVFGGN